MKTLLAADQDDTLGRAWFHVLSTLAGGEIYCWPPNGLPLNEVDILVQASSCLLLEPAPPKIALRFGESGEDRTNCVYRLKDPSGWSWLLNHFNENSGVRALNSSTTLGEALRRNSRRNPSKTTARLTCFTNAFHDMATNDWHDEATCRAAAALTADSGLPQLRLYRIFADQLYWDVWMAIPAGAPIREAFAELFECDMDQATAYLTETTPFDLWYCVNGQFWSWSMEESKFDRQPQVDRIVEVWQQTRNSHSGGGPNR